MAERPVYMVKIRKPFYEIANMEFTWNGGFAASQKQKNIKALHAEFSKTFPGKKVLEISSKSMQEGGTALSAFFLQKMVPHLGRSVPVECAYQAGKVFKNGGPFLDLLDMQPRDARRDPRLKTNGPLIHFTFEGEIFPLVPVSIFYDYLYLNALLEHEDLAKLVLQYDGFTDIEFNPNAGKSTQAKSAAVFVSLSRMGVVDQVRSLDSFLALYKKISVPVPDPAPKPIREPDSDPGLNPIRELDPDPNLIPEPDPEPVPLEKHKEIQAGFHVKHKAFDEGIVRKVDHSSLTIEFPTVGEKILGKKWCLANCEITEG
ncbi:MAG: hypothetical protein LUG93_04995 [Lachnospiraceae bacterium]|nr:hypothetical protein [Lachnospiraceae bacterium]